MKKLNFGCGFDLKEGWDNVDKEDFDFNEFPYPLKENTYEYVYLKDVLEHLFEPIKVLKELHKISKKNAIIEIIVPHYTNKGAYGSIEHNHYFNECAFEEFLQYNPNLFKLEEMKIVPTFIGKFIPSFLRKKLGLFINGLNSTIRIKYKVIK